MLYLEVWEKSRGKKSGSKFRFEDPGPKLENFFEEESLKFEEEQNFGGNFLEVEIEVEAYGLKKGKSSRENLCEEEQEEEDGFRA
ncbi:hypothetical protein TWF569_003765 [Orbilia oligospora]|uniref:Uncharacterized protein n=1 Tax=Orbilia oligospora TaxID=2813651 RepID=A0A7C8J2U5_ORBOL|nr:hypothetical protein TWF102_011740 [Orbilia oligospora]KAF3151637.1 hypothetical protein TWF569_003765 [Orbilia oligospora]